MNIRTTLTVFAASLMLLACKSNKNENMSTLNLTQEWDKTFPESELVNHSKVTFHNRYGIELAADMYVPRSFAGAQDDRLPAIAVSGPFGAVKEQSSGLYAQHMAERGFVTLAFDPSFTGESGGEPRRMASPDINTEDFLAAVDFLSNCDRVDPERIGIIGICGFGGMAVNAAALDPRIKAIAPSVPFLGDYRDYARIVWWPVHEVFAEADSIGLPREELLDMLRYFDVKNFAPRIHCPVYMAFGLQDPTCPPHTNFSIYNNLGTTDKRYLCVPTCGHGMWAEKVWETERAAFLHPFLYPLRVGTYNLRFSNLDNKSEENNWTLREPRLLQSFLTCDMDICGVEEIGSAEQESLPRQLSARGLSYDSYFFDPYADDGVGTRAHGLLWKKDLFSLAGEPHFFWLSNPPDVRQSNDTVPAWKANYTRGGFCLTLKDRADHKYFVMVTHAPLNKEQHAANASIYADMERRYNPEGLPSFFVGDFNANEADACSAVHRSYWADAYRAVPSPAGPEGTFNAWKWEAPSADHRIDFIYYRGEGVTPVAYTCDNTLYGGYPSDHFPVYADFFVMEQAPVRTAQVPF